MNRPLLPVLLIGAALAGCPGEDKTSRGKPTPADTTLVAAAPAAPKKPARPTPDTLTNEQLATIVAECQKVGTIVTDDYCKQCSYVLEKRLYNQAEAARRARNEASGREAAKKSESRSPDMFQR
jgi:hypothetical protein